MAKQQELNQLSQRQKSALIKALWVADAPDNTVFMLRMKRLLLRAFVIYQRREQLSADSLDKYCCDLRRRLKQCFALHSKDRLGIGLNKCHTPIIPYYLFLFFEEAISSSTPINQEQFPTMRKISRAASYVRRDTKHRLVLSHYHRDWVSWIRRCLAACTTNPKIVRLKKALGCISLIPIKVGGKPIKIRGRWLHYHDLFHLEVAQLERIRMGKDLVSGIHGINARVFHKSPLVEEYDSFLDEARIALHESLTRPTAFSQLKALCWMILLMLQGINPIAVLIRHIKSMKKKQEEFWN
ncbi:MAG: hypothetical protein LDL41_02755 [Coleofasciculus sp. S288]|nr:hypothetical protein [Coleofasciculus sp. S288]